MSLFHLPRIPYLNLAEVDDDVGAIYSGNFLAAYIPDETTPINTPLTGEKTFSLHYSPAGSDQILLKFTGADLLPDHIGLGF